MFDQSFSAENFLTIFNEENRKGHIAFDDMPENYRRIVHELKSLKNEMRIITSKKKSDRTTEEITKLDQLRYDVKLKQEERDRELFDELNNYAEIVNSANFVFPISHFKINDTQFFNIESSRWEHFYAIKNLQRTLKKLYGVKMSSRHQIMTNIKLILNTSIPYYIIRTDVESFFESIRQKLLFEKLDRNNLVNNKTKGLIKSIIQEFNKQKDSTDDNVDRGIPRGIGISSYLSEIYMHDIDEIIKSRGEVIFYARYVDDIFIILSNTLQNQSIHDYYRDLKELFLDYGLKLHHNGNTQSKCKLLEYYDGGGDTSFDYLGYNISISVNKNVKKVSFAMSNKKYDRIIRRIDSAFQHFENISAISLRRAKKDLIDSLNLISGNYRLTKSKSRIKAGLFLGSDLLDENCTQLDELTSYLREKAINPYHKVLQGTMARKKYIKSIQNIIDCIDFKERWRERTMFKFSSSRLKEISSWL